MTKRIALSALLSLAIVLTVLVALRSDTAANAQSADSPNDVVAGSRGSGGEFDRTITVSSHRMLDEGRRIFRYDTFGDEAFWGDTLRLHEAIAGSANGGVGPGVSPKTALAVGLKVDADALPPAVVSGIKSGAISLDDPATTLALLQLDAVVGVTGRFSPSKKIVSLGIQCSFCHSTVDDSFAPGIGHRLDGWPNRDLNVGAIVALSPDLSAVNRLLGVSDATTRTVLASWGPGKFDAELFLDGKAFRPDGKSAATLYQSGVRVSGPFSPSSH